MPEAPPFSRRIASSQWVQNNFPSTARTALLHLLYDVIEKVFVKSWIEIDKELRRIARKIPSEYDSSSVRSINEAKESANTILNELSWDKVFDFCERLHSHLAVEAVAWNHETDDTEITPRGEVQRYISHELQRLFCEENLAYSFDQGQVKRRGRSHTIKQIEKAEATLGDPRLVDARRHYKKALNYFNNYLNPDLENAVKEAVCAVESAARRLFPHAKAKTLSEVIKHIQGPQSGQIPKALAKTIDGLYAYRNSGDGVSHGGAAGGKATSNIAEYSLSLAASQIIFLHELASEAEAEANIPF